MEKRNIGIYLLIQFVWISALLCVRCIQIQDMMIESCSTECIVDELAISETATNYIPIETISSDQRIVDVDVLKKRADDEYEILTKIVEAEAGGEDIIGKMLVANVILDGRLMEENLRHTGKDEKWLRTQIKGQGADRMEDVLLATCDSSNQVTVFLKTNRKEAKNILM